MHLLIYHSSAHDTCLRMLNVGEVISPKVLLWKPKMCETELPVCFILGLHCIITNAPVHCISRRELNKAKALAQQEDVTRPSNQLKQRSSLKSGKKRVSQEGKSNDLEARFLKEKETPVKNTISEFEIDEDNDDDGEAPKGGKMKGKQVQSSSTSKGRTGSSGKVFKHSVGDSSTEKPTTSRDSEGDAAAALSPDMSPGDGEPLNTWVIRRQKAH
jgi:hypothetical protein